MQTHRTHIAAVIAAAFLVAFASACGSSAKTGGAGAPTTVTSSADSSALVGAGSTLVAPLLTKWQGEYSSARGATITYGAIGSGGGIQAITDRTVDFGASDAPLSSSQASACTGCVQIPWALAATTLSYNLPGISKPLRLSGPVIEAMFVGKITQWNDPQIAKLNPGVKLPSTRVNPVWRNDASGDTYAFSSYLSSVSPEFKQKYGASTEINWQAGFGERGNSGVVAGILSTPGAIGYVAIGQAIGSSLHYASVENAAGQFVKPSTGSIAAAGATARFARDNSAAIVNPPASAAHAYPISTFTYAIVAKSSSKLAALQKFLGYAVTKGQQDATALDFAPLPPSVVAKDRAIIRGL
jgi:phosphate transport system substrate-binding protein